MNFPPFKFIFFGTPEPAVDILNYLKEAGLVPQLIVTNPDKLVGRNKILTPSPVKLWAIKNKISIFQPIRLDENSLSKIKELDCELFLVVAYGGLIPKTILDLPKYGVLNVHYSLLPRPSMRSKAKPLFFRIRMVPRTIKLFFLTQFPIPSVNLSVS
jgi:methionyl-tRNA formyltransferase